MTKLAKHTTFRFDPTIKSQFQEETEANGTTMVEVLQKMMENYIKLSKKRRDGKKA
jgi:hypothetical protein